MGAYPLQAAVSATSVVDLREALSELSQHQRARLRGALEGGQSSLPEKVTVTVTSAGGSQLSVSCLRESLVDDLKVMIADQLQVDRSQVSFMLGSHMLEAKHTLEEAGILCGDVSFIVTQPEMSSLLQTGGSSASPSKRLKVPGTPVGNVFLSQDSLAVVNHYNDRIHIFDVSSGEITRSFGAGVVKYPRGLCYCEVTQAVYVCDCGNSRVAAFSSCSFEFTESFCAAPGYPYLSQPYGVAVTRNGDMLAVTDYDTNYCHVIRIQGCSGEPQQRDAISSLVHKGDSMKFPTTFYAPSGIAFADNDKFIVVCDTFEDRIIVFEAATLQCLWERSVPRKLNPTSIVVAGQTVLVLMSKRNGGYGTRCSIFQHPVYPNDTDAHQWSLLHDDIDNDNETGGLANWRNSVLAVTAGNAKEVLVFQ